MNPFRFQIQEVTKMRDAVLEHTLNDKSEKLTVLKKAADDIFAPAATLKLALLGKLWGYDALYDSCKARIIADPMPHALSPLWKSPLLCAGVRRCSSSPPSSSSSSRSRDPLPGLITEVLVALPARTVIDISELQPPQVLPPCAQPRPQHGNPVSSLQHMALLTTLQSHIPKESISRELNLRRKVSATVVCSGRCWV